MSITKRMSKKRGMSYRVDVYDPLTQTTKWVGTFYDEIQAKQAQLDAEKHVRAGLSPASNESPKLDELIEKWLAYTKNDSTRDDYSGSGKFFREFFGQRRIRSVKAEDFHRFVSFMCRKTNHNGKAYAPRTIRKVVTQLYQLMNFAVELGYLDRSPAPRMKRLALPELSAPRKVELTRAKIDALLMAPDDYWRDCVLVAVSTGVRRGELFGLRYSDVDWARGVLHVFEQLKDRGAIGSTKSRAGVREIPLPSIVIDALQSRRDRLQADANDLIFTNTFGGPVSYPNFYRRVWKPAIEKAGLEKLHLHDLRKAFATKMVEAGHTPAYLEAVMGHRSFSTTMKYYAKSTEEEARRARQHIEDWLVREAADEDEQVAAA